MHSQCQSEMKILSIITEFQIIRKILKYLDLWEEEQARYPPQADIPGEIVYIPVNDIGWKHHESPVLTV
jgi:hypothetical protein